MHPRFSVRRVADAVASVFDPPREETHTERLGRLRAEMDFARDLVDNLRSVAQDARGTRDEADVRRALAECEQGFRARLAAYNEALRS